MKEHHIERMNFIAKRGFVLDYQHIVILLAAWVLFLILLVGIQHFRYWMVRHDISKAKEQLSWLMQEQERRLTMLQATGSRIDSAHQQDLMAVFKNPPVWSVILGEVQKNILPHVRITQMISNEDLEKRKFVLRLEGVAPSMRLIVEFMQRLRTSPFLNNLALVEAKRDKSGRAFNYVIEARVLMAKGRTIP